MAESMQGLHRSHRCTEVNNTMIGNTVTVMGWVQKSRNKGESSSSICVIEAVFCRSSLRKQTVVRRASQRRRSFVPSLSLQLPVRLQSVAAQSMRILQPVISKSSRRISVSLQKQIHHHSQSRRTARRRKIFV